MKDFSALKQRIQERYPQGLTGVFALGGTRTSYILEHNRDSEQPGTITDFAAYARYGIDGNFNFIRMFFDMGGSHALMTATSFQLLEDKRGPQYPELVARTSGLLHDETAQAFYRENNIDPYFTGLDILMLRPEGTPQRRMGAAMQEFCRTWDYQPGRHKVVWEIAPIPLYTFRYADDRAGEAAQAEFEAKLTAEPGYVNMFHLLYDYYASAAYGTHIPIPQFYLASNRNGDLKPRAFLPFALEASAEMRMYFTPYPSLFMTPEALETILEDLVVDKRVRSYQSDYKDQLTPEVVNQMYQNFKGIAADPKSTVGLSRNPGKSDDDD